MPKKKKSGRKILVTAGPTRAYLDRVRFLSNVSTGALGFEICQYLISRGHEVHGVIGPSAYPFASLKFKSYQPVETNEEMLTAVLRTCRKHKPHAGIFSAAVLDFVPAKIRAGKVSSRVKRWDIRLRPAKKILDEVKKKHPRVARLGFKLEWDKRRGEELKTFAAKYIKRKGLYGLCLNFLAEVGPEKHRAVYVAADGRQVLLTTKKEIARQLALVVEELSE